MSTFLSRLTINHVKSTRERERRIRVYNVFNKRETGEMTNFHEGPR